MIFPHTHYTYKEKRKRILTMSFKKLIKINHPESILNKAVLINNMSEASHRIQVET